MGVVVTISGTATLNTHFTVSPAFQSATGVVVIPAGQASVDITVTATGSPQDGDTIILTVTPSPIFSLVQASQTLTFSGGSIEGDPHVFGIMGQIFDFQGQPKRTYNLLSDTHLQVSFSIHFHFISIQFNSIHFIFIFIFIFISFHSLVISRTDKTCFLHQLISSGMFSLISNK